MSHEVLITRRQSIFIFFANPGRGGPQHPNQPAPASTDLLRPASAWICKKIINALSSGYQDLMGHQILTTSPWSVLTWITLISIVWPQIGAQTLWIRNKSRGKQMSLSPPILEGRISNFYQIWEGFHQQKFFRNFIPRYSFNYLLGNFFGSGKS